MSKSSPAPSDRQSTLAVPSIVVLFACLLMLVPGLGWAVQTSQATDTPVRQTMGTIPGMIQYQGTVSSTTVTQGYRGPFFTLPTLVQLLGGSLDVGPLKQSHTLILGDDRIVIGPDSMAMVIGQEIIDLSQIPMASTSGIQVPLDFLRKTYGDLLGFSFDWIESDRRLVVSRGSGETMPVSVDWLHSQGTTTLVLMFPRRPRYEVFQEERLVRVDVLGDNLTSGRVPPVMDDPFVRGVSLNDRSITIEIAPGVAAAEPYENDRGSRYEVVFDIAQGVVPVSSPTGSGLGETVLTNSQGAGTVVSGIGAQAGSALPRPGRQAGGPMRIVVDPGHGGPEAGAVGKSGTLEKDLTLLLARSFKRLVESRMSATVILTRSSDEDLDLEARTALANQNQADLFISLHLNSEPWASGARGAETYFLNAKASDDRAANAAAFENRGAGGSDEDMALELMLWDLAQNQHMADSQRLAKLIQQELNLTLNLRDRGVKQAPFRVLMGATMPAVLVELGFLSNPEEEKKLLEPSYRQELVESLVDSLERFRSRGSQ